MQLMQSCVWVIFCFRPPHQIVAGNTVIVRQQQNAVRLMSLPLSDSYLPSADFEMPTSAESCSKVSFRSTRKSFNLSPIVSLTCIQQPPFSFFCIISCFSVLCLKAWKNPPSPPLFLPLDYAMKSLRIGCQLYLSSQAPKIRRNTKLLMETEVLPVQQWQTSSKKRSGAPNASDLLCSYLHSFFIAE